MRKRGKILNKIIFLVIACMLITAARYSECFVPKGFSKADFDPSVIEHRDNMYGAAMPDDKTVWIAGHNGKIVRSDDGGKTWRVESSGRTEHLHGISAWDSKRAVAAGNDGLVIYTHDSGASWHKADAPKSKIVNKLFRVRTLPDGHAWAVGVMGMIIHSKDWGKTWQRRIEEEDVGWNDIDFADALTAVVVGEFGRIKRTTDYGTTWMEVDSPVDTSLTGISFLNDQIGIAVGLGGVLLSTTDSGNTWEVIPDSGTKEHLLTVKWIGSEWVAVGNGGIYVTGDVDGNILKTQQLSASELLWHTDIVPLSAKRLLIVGGSQGVLSNDKWEYLN